MENAKLNPERLAEAVKENKLSCGYPKDRCICQDNIQEIVETAMKDAYELFKLSTTNPSINLTPKCADELYLDFFIKLAILYLIKNGYNIHEVKTISYPENDEYTIITLDEYIVEIRNTVSCGAEMEFFEYIVKKRD